MNVRVVDEYVYVTLSERNLKTLTKLWEAAYTQDAVPAIHRRDGDLVVSVRIEPDDIHYLTRTPGIGPDDV